MGWWDLMAQSDPRHVVEQSSTTSSRPRIALAGMAVIALAVGAALLYLVASAFDGAHDGQIAGDEAMALSAALGLFGLGLAIANRWLRNAYIGVLVRVFLVAGIAYLTMGALMGNARWSLPGWRAIGYLGVIGGAWATEYLLARSGEETDVAGLVSLAATGAGLYVLAFEVVRWLEPSFRVAPGTLTAEIFALQESTKAHWTFLVWNLYALAVLAAGAVLQSTTTRRLAQVFGLLSVAYGLLICFPRPEASTILRSFGLVTALLMLGGVVWSFRYSKHRLDP